MNPFYTKQILGLPLIVSFIFLVFNKSISQTCANQMNNHGFTDERVCENDTTDQTSIIDLTNGTFLGMTGGLYPGGTNQMPTDHQSNGIDLSDQILPLDESGNVDLDHGKIVFASIGMSNCARFTQHFHAEANASPELNPDVTLLNLAIGGKDIDALLTGNYFAIVDTILSSGSRSDDIPIDRRQVQAVWFLQATHISGIDPNEGTSHIDLVEDKFLQAFIRLKQEFPNLKQIYCSGRSYGGYNAVGTGNPEPYAYYTNWAFKKLVDRQVNGDPLLNQNDVPWIAWAGHIWADGTKASSDGHTWECDDFICDGTHPSILGKQKVTPILMDFFTTDPTAEWFRETSDPTCTVGDPCDDGDSNTTDDEYDVNCLCVGTPSNSACAVLGQQGLQFTFESGLDNWTQRTNDGTDWIRQTGETATPQTGPLTATNGSYYIYLEADDGQNMRAVLESPCIDIGTAETVFLSFASHMQGQDVNRLRVAVQPAGMNLQPKLSVLGDQGADWVTHQIDMTAYVGQSVQILIEGTTGNGAEGDIAVDDIRLNYCNANEFVNDDINTSGILQASDFISSDALISSSELTFRAEHYIDLVQHFEVSQGSLFIAEIGACL